MGRRVERTRCLQNVLNLWCRVTLSVSNFVGGVQASVEAVLVVGKTVTDFQCACFWARNTYLGDWTRSENVAWLVCANADAESTASSRATKWGTFIEFWEE